MITQPAMSMPESIQHLLGILDSCLSPDTSMRLKGEQHLQVLSNEPEIASVLLQVAMEQSVDLTKRQLAVVALKNHIEGHWSSRTERFVGPETSEPLKSILRGHLLMALSDASQMIRANVAHCISKIAHSDWPEQWPSLFDDLLSYLKSSNVNQVQGAMRVLTDFVRDDMTDQQFPLIAPVLVTELLRILKSESTYPVKIRASCMSMFVDLLQMLDMLRSEHPQVIEQLMQPWLNPFMEVCTNILSKGECMSLTREVMVTLVAFIKMFPQQASPYVSVLVDLSWRNFEAVSTSYVRKMANDEELETVSADSENVVDEAHLVDEFIQFYMLLLMSKLFSTVFVDRKTQMPSARMNEMMKWMVLLMQVDEDALFDFSQFVGEELEESANFSVRMSAVEFVMEAMERDGLATVRSLVPHLEVILSNERLNWKQHEAALLALSKCLPVLMEHVATQQMSFDVQGLFQSVLMRKVMSTEPVLRGRALVVSSMVVNHLKESVHLRMQMMQLALEFMTADEAWLPFFSLKAVPCLLEDASLMQQDDVLRMLMERMANLMQRVQEQSMQELCLETMVGVMRTSSRIVATCFEPLVEMMVRVWFAYKEDTVMCSILLEFVDVMCEVDVEKMECGVMSTLVQVLSGHHEVDVQLFALETLQKMLNARVSQKKQGLGRVYVQQVFPVLMQCLQAASDVQIVQEGQEVLKSFVELGMQELLMESNGVMMVLQFLVGCLHVERDESLAVFAGPLLVKMLEKGESHLMPVLSDVLKAVAMRLEKATRPDVVQSLVVVFCSMMRQGKSAQVLDFLMSLRLEIGSGLEVFLRKWSESFVYFNGFHDLQLCLMTMSQLFESGDARLLNVMVQGDLVVQEEQRIRTRSRAKDVPETYTQIPFGLKVIKLMLREYAQQLESKMDAFEEVSSCSDWEEEQGSCEGEDGDVKMFVKEFLMRLSCHERMVQMCAEGLSVGEQQLLEGVLKDL